MDLQSIYSDYQTRFFTRYGNTLSLEQRSAFNAVTGCRQGQYGDLLLNCQECLSHGTVARSCGHRACNQCQNQSTEQWLDRQLQKQLPVDYYMATFTLPFELRGLCKAQPKIVFTALIRSAIAVLKRFGHNKKSLHAELGMCAVLHTHSRRLDYHPHVHIVLPGGGVHRARQEWRKVSGKYLFNGRALAKAFRGELLNQLRAENLSPPTTPKKWIVQCKKVGKGKEALQYLSRYLYRGVINNKNIIENDDTHVTFRYKDSETKHWKTRKLKGEEFIALVLQHTLPKGFRRARDYGFLHGNAKQILRIVQWVLRVAIPEKKEKKKAKIPCPHCHGVMHVTGIRPARASPKQK